MSKIWLIALLAGLIPVFGTVGAAPPQADDKPRLTLEQLRAKYGDKAGHIAKIGGVEVYYKDEGKGPAILMIHGSRSTLETYDIIAAKLKSHYRVIRYDIPPYGLSGSISDEQAANLQATDIPEQLLEQLGVKSVTAVGVSSGGTLVSYLAAKRPDLVKRLIVSNAPSDPVDDSHMNRTPAYIAAEKEAKDTNFENENFWKQFLTFFSGVPNRMTPRIIARYYDYNRRVPENHPISLVGLVANHAKATEQMGKVTQPTLLVWGARDPLLIPPTADILAGYLNHTQLSKIMLPDVGHYPPLEAPERFAQIIATYIEAVAPDEALVPAPAR
jgi:pimeloyl-ACP methyl ester carboxylesterase